MGGGWGGVGGVGWEIVKTAMKTLLRVAMSPKSINYKPRHV